MTDLKTSEMLAERIARSLSGDFSTECSETEDIAILLPHILPHLTCVDELVEVAKLGRNMAFYPGSSISAADACELHDVYIAKLDAALANLKGDKPCLTT